MSGEVELVEIESSSFEVALKQEYRQSEEAMK